jgi:hypothetical protein
MDADLRQTVEAIHASPYQIVIVCAGAGGRAIEQLVALPGSSRTVLEAVIPYGRPAFEAFLGRETEQFTAAAVSRALAERAYERACRWADAAARPLGVACTATLATTRPKRGDHRAFITLRNEHSVVTHTLVLAKGARDRLGEEEVVSRLIVAALAEACGVEGDAETRGRGDAESSGEENSAPLVSPVSASPRPRVSASSLATLLLLPQERLDVERQDVRSLLGRLRAGEAPAVLVLPDGQMREEFPTPGVLFPGAFNPLHAGHIELARTAARRLGVPVTFELSATNVDKPPLAEPELRQRLAQFAWRHPVIVSDAPTFAQKARLFPGCVFVIGADTLERLFAPRYYGGEEAMLAALSEIRSRGCRFLVAGRHYNGAYRPPDGFPILPAFRPLFDFIPEEDFRRDLSSTEIRRPR